MERVDPEAAEAKYNKALTLDSDLPAAQIGLARIALEQGRLDDAQARIVSLERRGFLEPEAERLKAELILRSQASQPAASKPSARPWPPTPTTRISNSSSPKPSPPPASTPMRWHLCLELVERDRKGIGEQARQTMIAIFQLLPPDSELVTEYQRQLSVALRIDRVASRSRCVPTFNTRGHAGRPAGRRRHRSLELAGLGMARLITRRRGSQRAGADAPACVPGSSRLPASPGRSRG